MCECQTVLYFKEQTEEGEGEGESGTKEDDDAETAAIKEVIEKYNLFGKVRTINASQDMEDVYKDTKRALLPEVFFLIGPKASGKTTIGEKLAERSNMKLMNFDQFIKENSLQHADDEKVVFALIRALLDEVSPRILLEGFPQNQNQATWFIRNCTEQAKVFYCKCSKDTCQERMIAL